MPFGLNGAPASILSAADGPGAARVGFSAAYIDDVVIFSSTWEDHLTSICTVLDQLRQAGLTAKPRKCQFGMSECAFLGHIVGGGKVKPLPSKIEAVLTYPVPGMKKQVCTFLGLTGYYHKFIPNYAEIAALLMDLTKKAASTEVQWTTGCHTAFM